MPLFTQDSLEALRHRVDIVEVLAPYIDLKRAGASYKALCPFHDEKSPSFMVQKGDSHYHCFGCGAHGDAIQFLMTHVKMNFSDAVESLAQKFGVLLQVVEGGQASDQVNKGALKQATEAACQLYEFCLLHSEQGQEALGYLYSRGIDLDFIKQFRIGFAPSTPGLFQKVMHEKRISNQTLVDAGLLTHQDGGRWREFFSDRITFPICDASGAVIGFSARKYKEATFGGKYVNTSETHLFKKSRVLFGLHHCRRRIAKERKAIIVEGQIDALRLIFEGFNITVAGQGTAFGEGHVQELLNLGVTCVYLALDADTAGQQATVKVGDLFQKEGVEVKILSLPEKMDPDGFLRERGSEAFAALMESATDYLSFLIGTLTREVDMSSPAAKNEVVGRLVKQIRGWKHSLMIHESLRKVSQVLSVPEEVLGVGQDHMPNLFIKKSSTVGLQTFDLDRIMEGDFLVWILLMAHEQPRLLELAKRNIVPENLHVAECAKLYQRLLDNYAQGTACDFLALAAQTEEPEQKLIQELVDKKINWDRADQQFHEAIQKILDRNWMEERHVLSQKIKGTTNGDDEAVFELLRQLSQLQKNPPRITQ
jgi:DNA primase